MPPKFSRQTYEKLISPEWAESQPRTSPCEAHCPAGNPIQKVSTLIADGEVDEALSYLRMRNPFPGITGRVCSHPCEESCNRNCYDQSVSIRALERFAADHADSIRTKRPHRKGASGKTAAVIGSGPAGLTCAYFLALLGHQVIIFESTPVLGGIPRLAIPDFRLPKDIVERETSSVFDLGVEVRFNTKVGKDVAFSSIADEYDACVIATGTWKERRLDVPGGDFASPGVAFLQNVNMGWKGPIGQRVVIVGGGGVAFDCAFAAKRLGAPAVTVVCVEGAENMCAAPDDLVRAQEEGIAVLNSTSVKSVVNDGRTATGVEYVGISSFCFDDSLCLAIETNGEVGTIEADTVISAVGVSPDVDFLVEDGRFTFSPRNTIRINPSDASTAVAKVFAAGDVVSGPSSVASAIGSGRRAALAVARYLSGQGAETGVTVRIDATGEVVSESCPDYPHPPHVVTFDEILNVDFHEKRPRRKVEPVRLKSGANIAEGFEGGFSAESATMEASRCFHCGHCTSCGNCVVDCPLYVLSMSSTGPQVAHFDECWHCGCCRIACPSGAVLYEFPLNMLV